MVHIEICMNCHTLGHINDYGYDEILDLLSVPDG